MPRYPRRRVPVSPRPSCPLPHPRYSALSIPDAGAVKAGWRQKWDAMLATAAVHPGVGAGREWGCRRQRPPVRWPRPSDPHASCRRPCRGRFPWVASAPCRTLEAVCAAPLHPCSPATPQVWACLNACRSAAGGSRRASGCWRAARRRWRHCRQCARGRCCVQRRCRHGRSAGSEPRPTGPCSSWPTGQAGGGRRGRCEGTAAQSAGSSDVCLLACVEYCRGARAPTMWQRPLILPGHPGSSTLTQGGSRGGELQAPGPWGSCRLPSARGRSRDRGSGPQAHNYEALSTWVRSRLGGPAWTI